MDTPRIYMDKKTRTAEDIGRLKLVKRLEPKDQEIYVQELKKYNEIPEQIPLKMWYCSKTIWVNLIAIASIVLASHTGLYIPPEITTLLLSTINILLRMITKQEVIWSQDK
jgi:cytochrome b subunit of formate dehydrogenase